MRDTRDRGWYNQGIMHTHFGSATNGTAMFLHVLVMGSVWRVGWLHVLAKGRKNGNPHVQGIAKAALFQY